MRASYAKNLASRPEHYADACAWLAGAVDPWLDRIAQVAPGRLFSLSLDLPPDVLDVGSRGQGDRLWISPQEGAACFGGGEVAGYGDIGAAQWRDERRRWARMGDHGAAPPIAFFTAPPAPEGGPARLSLPKILVRRDRGRQSVVLSAFRDGAPAAAVARDWMMQFLALADRSASHAGGGIETRICQPDRNEWGRRVRAATAAIAAGRFAKVVLARKLVLSLRRELDADAFAQNLAEACPNCRIVKLPHERGLMVAASPETLAAKRGARLVSHAVAGTAARAGAWEADLEEAEKLLASPKERREHALVVEAIAGALSEICDEVGYAPIPSIMRLKRLQHLWTPVSGRLRPGYDLLAAVARLHPTPAVLGSPRSAARDWLRAAEPRRNGLYTGVAGWVDADGDGEAAVVLRSAYFEGREAHLWAGAGIMAESDAKAEWAETELKMATLLDFLAGSGL